MNMRERLYEAVVVTAEVIGHEISPAAATAMSRELMTYPEIKVVHALNRCRRELSNRLTLAAVIQRIDDGHLGVEEAWALIPRSEADTVVWTDEIAQAYGVCRGLLETDQIAARMAFKEAYTRAITEARAERRLADWWVCAGHDQAGRVSAIKQAVEVGRLTAGEAEKHVHPDMPGYHALASAMGHVALPAPIKTLPAGGAVSIAEEVNATLKTLRSKGDL